MVLFGNNVLLRIHHSNIIDWCQNDIVTGGRLKMRIMYCALKEEELMYEDILESR